MIRLSAISESDGLSPNLSTKTSAPNKASAETYGVADEVARRVLSTGGEVLSVRAEDMPEPGKAVAAILRYPI